MTGFFPPFSSISCGEFEQVANDMVTHPFGHNWLEWGANGGILLSDQVALLAFFNMLLDISRHTFPNGDFILKSMLQDVGQA